MIKPSIEIQREEEGGKKGEMERHYMNKGMSELKILKAKNGQRGGEKMRGGWLLVFEVLK